MEGKGCFDLMLLALFEQIVGMCISEQNEIHIIPILMIHIHENSLHYNFIWT